MPPGVEVAVYVKIVDPPSNTGGVYVTVAKPLPAVADPIVGAPGTMAVRVGLTATPVGLVPTDTVATTVLVAVSITETLLLLAFAT